MIQKNTRKQYGLQMLRAIAALAVLFHHTLEESNGVKTSFSPDWLTTFGASGVDIFFVISGFIMLYTSFRPERAPITPGAFLFRRVSRIYPLYWVCCVFMLSIMFAGFLRNNRPTQSEVALSFMLLPNARNIIGVSWTLIHEVYFYVIFAITLIFRSALVSAIVTPVLIAVIGLASGMLDSEVLGTFLTNPIHWEFTLGLWIAFAFIHVSSVERHWAVSPFWAVPGFILLACAPLYVYHENTSGIWGWSRILFWGLPAAVIVAAFLSISDAKTLFQRTMVFLGDASYSIYLSHSFVMIGYGLILRATLISQVPQIVIAPLIMILAVAVGLGTNILIENPLLKLIHHWTKREPLISEPTTWR